VAVDKNRFCSVGNDDYLCLWDNSGTLLGKISRQVADKGESMKKKNERMKERKKEKMEQLFLSRLFFLFLFFIHAMFAICV
jgi:hypothetical protein